MKAIRMHAVGGPDVLQVDEVDTPRPGADQVLIKVEAAAVAYGDIMKRRGDFGHDLPLPSGLGLAVAGTVSALGPDTAAPVPGTRVLAWVEHGYAEYAVAPSGATIPLPDGLDMGMAAVLPVQGLTAYQALTDAGHLRPGESVLVHAAAGAVGSVAVQCARLLDAGTVIGTASRPDKLEHIRDLGAAAAVDYTHPDWPQEVLEATDGRGVDLVLDSVGGTVAGRSLECLAPFGRMVSFGAASGQPAPIATMSLMHDNLSVTGYSLGGWLGRTDRTANAMEDLLRYVSAGQLSVPIAQCLPLGSAAGAHTAIGERRTIGATVLLP